MPGKFFEKLENRSCINGAHFFWCDGRREGILRLECCGEGLPGPVEAGEEASRIENEVADVGVLLEQAWKDVAWATTHVTTVVIEKTTCRFLRFPLARTFSDSWRQIPGCAAGRLIGAMAKIPSTKPTSRVLEMPYAPCTSP